MQTIAPTTPSIFEIAHRKTDKYKQRSVFNRKVKVIKVPEFLKTAIINGKEIIEVTQLNLIDSRGFCYDFNTLPKKSYKTLSYWLDSI